MFFFSKERKFEAVWTKTLHPPSVIVTTNILNATTLLRDDAGALGVSWWRCGLSRWGLLRDTCWGSVGAWTGGCHV